MAKRQYTDSEKETILRLGKRLHSYIESDNGGNWLSDVTYTRAGVIMYDGKYYWAVDRGFGNNLKILEFEEIK